MDEILRPLAAPRHFLVVARVGDSSQHFAWVCGDPSRNWDLLVNYYGKRDDFEAGSAEYFSRRGISKFPGASEIYAAAPFLLVSYDATIFIDDDIEVAAGDLSRLFERFVAHRLQLGQPALSANSHFSHDVTIVNPTTIVRYTDFVEVMMPIFRREALGKCLPTFATSVSGWGLDWAWPSRIGFADRQTGIIDEVVLRHVKPVDPENGPFYRYLRSLGINPWTEMAGLLAKHGLRQTIPRQLGSVRRPMNPNVLAMLTTRRGLI